MVCRGHCVPPPAVTQSVRGTGKSNAESVVLERELRVFFMDGCLFLVLFFSSYLDFGGKGRGQLVVLDLCFFLLSYLVCGIFASDKRFFNFQVFGDRFSVIDTWFLRYDGFLGDFFWVDKWCAGSEREKKWQIGMQQKKFQRCFCVYVVIYLF